jgi:hypothetical protein
LNKRRSPQWLTLLTIIFGAILLFWLSVEDTGWLIVAFGAGLSILLTLRGAFRLQRHISRAWIVFGVVLGTLAGAGSIVATLLLMLVKTSLHGHMYPDYSFQLMISMAGRIPAWGAAGALVGLAVALLSYGRRGGPDDPGALS